MRRTAILAVDRPADRLRAIEIRTAPPHEIYVADGATLQQLYEQARRDGAHYVALIGSCVTPVRDGWLTGPIAMIDNGAALVATADTGPDAPGFLVTTVEFIESQGLSFDDDRAAARFVSTAEEAELTVARVAPIVPDLPDFPDHIYGDLVHDEGFDSEAVRPDRRHLHAEMLRNHRDEYLAWRRGVINDRTVFFVLGMHRSGTSSLTSCLERCGLYLGDVVRRTLSDQPRGSFERLGLVEVNDRLLASAGGTWKDPPDRELVVSQSDAETIAEIVAELEARSPAGVKDPRLLLTLGQWTSTASQPMLIGTFRHPSAVARSLLDRDAIPMEQGYELWNVYNGRLVRLHEQHGFPLIEFDLSDRMAYARQVVAVASELGLRPRLGPVLSLLERPTPGRDIGGDAPVPASCRATHDYLREHRYDGVIGEGSFASLLFEWALSEELSSGRASSRDIDLAMWNLARRFPRIVRATMWRVWYRVRGGEGLNRRT